MDCAAAGSVSAQSVTMRSMHPHTPATRFGRLVLALAAAVAPFACAHAPLNVPLTRPLTQAEVNRERPLPTDKTKDLDLVVSFSGGGVRAAALAYGVLQGL